MDIDTDSLLWYAAGLGIGIALGLLLAPESGKQIRASIVDRASDGAAYLKRQGSAFVDRARGSASNPQSPAATNMEGQAAWD